jgi:predicted dehydrogenase
MHKQYDRLPAQGTSSEAAHVGVLGCGKFSFSTVLYYLQRNVGAVVQHVMDIDVARAASLAEHYGVPRYGTSIVDVLDDPSIDLVYIASNHASHAEYAIEALRRGKSVHIEKPHAVTEDQLERLVAAMRSSAGKVELGFNRPDSRIGMAIAEAMQSQSGSMMLNWFVAGHELPEDHWYYAPEEGGRVLGNLCHWTDFVFRMVPPANRFPIDIVPVSAGQSDCDISVNYVFGEGTVAAITFSAKGHTFEGVRETFSAHRGDVLLAMRDFRVLTVESGARKRTMRRLFRDHGHERGIMRSYSMVRPIGGSTSQGRSPEYVRGTGLLFLRTKEALEQRRSLRIEAPPLERPAAPRSAAG